MTVQAAAALLQQVRNTAPIQATSTFSPGASSEELVAGISSLDGRGPAEAAGALLEAGTHPNADMAVFRRIVARADTMARNLEPIDPGAAAQVRELRAQLQVLTADSAPSAPPPPQRPVSPAPSSGTPASDVLTGAALSTTVSPVHRGDPVFIGPYSLNTDALNNMSLEAAGDFGVARVSVPNPVTGEVVVHRSSHLAAPHPDDPTKCAIKLIPCRNQPGHGYYGTSGGDMIIDSTGQQVKGHEILAAEIRKVMGLRDDTPVFATATYGHPEDGAINAGGGEPPHYMPQRYSSHTGRIVGDGFRVTSAPEGYQSEQLSPGNWSLIVVGFELKGEDPNELAHNGNQLQAMLNYGVPFSSDYTADKVRASTLAKQLTYFKDWVTMDADVRDNPDRWVYCAEHQSMLDNLNVNLPMNPEMFTEIWGPTEGPRIWEAANSLHEQATGETMTPRYFEPLWKKEAKDLGLTDFNPARDDRGFHFAQAMPTESNADLVLGVIDNYFSPAKMSSLASMGALMSFRDQSVDRMDIAPEVFDMHAIPVIQQMMVHEALCGEPSMAGAPGPMLDAWAQQMTQAVFLALGGRPDHDSPTAQQLSQTIMSVFQQPEIRDVIAAAQPMSRMESAKTYLWPALQPILESAHAIEHGADHKAERNAAPGTFVATMQHPDYRLSSPKHIEVKYIGHAIDAQNIEGVSLPPAAEEER